jgi:hypothetical protein
MCNQFDVSEVEVCVWVQGPDKVYETGCGNSVYHIDDVVCPFCLKLIEFDNESNHELNL